MRRGGGHLRAATFIETAKRVSSKQVVREFTHCIDVNRCQKQTQQQWLCRVAAFFAFSVQRF
eukprot:4822579-Pleurochrysis_carterae.AAC.2